MAEWVQENRRAVVMLAVAMSIALLAGLYLVLSGGNSPEELPPVTRVPLPRQPSRRTPQPRKQSSKWNPLCASIPGAAPAPTPFAPVEGGKKGTGSDTASEPTAKPTSKPSEPRKDPASTTTRQDPAVHTSPSTKPSSKDPAPKPDDPQPVAPEPIGGPDKNGEELLVRVVDVQPDVMTARVNGRRTKLYLNEPSEPGGLTYLAPLGGGCAWVGMPDTEVRFSVCKGKTERL